MGAPELLRKGHAVEARARMAQGDRLASSMTRYTFDPIGVVHSPFTERAEAPRQAPVRADVAGRIELFAGHDFAHALDGIAAWKRVWILFVFHKNVEQGRGWKAKVLPPRSDRKLGVFATRSPHRPNPIGMSAVAIERVEALTIHVRGLDLLDQTPVLDLKPYVAYADAFSDGGPGWLGAADPMAAWSVSFAAPAVDQLEWLRARGVHLQAPIEAALSLGPHPHAYRRIRPHGGAMRLALKDWRVDFVVEDRRMVVQRVASGYAPNQLTTDPCLERHREFVAMWG